MQSNNERSLRPVSNLSIDKVISARFVCPTCNKISNIRADKSGNFAQYMQCIHCEQHIELHTQQISSKLNIHIMSSSDVEWLKKIQLRQDAQKPLIVYRTKEIT